MIEYTVSEMLHVSMERVGVMDRREVGWRFLLGLSRGVIWGCGVA